MSLRTVTEGKIKDRLAHLNDPAHERNLLSAGDVRHIEVHGGDVKIELQFDEPTSAMARDISQTVETQIITLPGVTSVRVHCSSPAPDRPFTAGETDHFERYPVKHPD